VLNYGGIGLDPLNLVINVSIASRQYWASMLIIEIFTLLIHKGIVLTAVMKASVHYIAVPIIALMLVNINFEYDLGNLVANSFQNFKWDRYMGLLLHATV